MKPPSLFIFPSIFAIYIISYSNSLDRLYLSSYLHEPNCYSAWVSHSHHSDNIPLNFANRQNAVTHL
ncbi:hypothetical protein Y1Q_0023012 [Alligator mississippiensis]|uniref:Uncharacterized protein n=1 Tax=Alligator mississippiensis TaxID=8496 RepID=A0A151P792_ALLMI|nr:hypothetical protein Y1Q_0023012 [Alligator mississippiensis]